MDHECNLMSAIIPIPMYRIPSELRKRACLGRSSTMVGDVIVLGSPCVAPLVFENFICIYVILGKIEEGVVQGCAWCSKRA